MVQLASMILHLRNPLTDRFVIGRSIGRVSSFLTIALHYNSRDADRVFYLPRLLKKQVELA